MKWVVALVAVAATATGLAVWRFGKPPASDEAPPVPGEAIPLRVEVLNGTAIDGLARRATHYLRRKGLDVVSFGSAPGEDRDSTVLLVRRGDSTTAIPVRDALGFGSIAVELDARLLLDVTVVLGRDAAPLDGYP